MTARNVETADERCSPTLVSQVANILVGLGIASLTLVLMLGASLSVYGTGHFELGIWLSFGLSWVVVLTGYALGTGVMLLFSWLLKRIGSSTKPRFSVFGFLMVLLMWTMTEVPRISQFRAEFASTHEGLVISVLFAAAIGLVSGWYWDRQKAPDK